MKKIVASLAIATIGLTMFSGCSKSSSSSSPTYSMKATVGTTAFNGGTCVAIASGSALSIQGYTGTSSTTPPYLNITIQSYTGAASYPIDSTALVPNVTATYSADATLSNVKTSKSGNVTITSATSTAISGTFTIKCSDGTSISGGTFTAKKY